MKKLLCLMLALMMLVCVGCKDNENDTADSTEGGSVTTAPDFSALLEGIAASNSSVQINGGVYSYFFFDAYRSFVSENYYYLSSYGLDINKSLKEQSVPNAEMTWFDYFVSQTKSEVSQMLVFAAYAAQNGITVSDSDKQAIEDYLTDVREYAEKNEFASVDDYYAEFYGAAMTEEVVRAAFEFRYLALTAYESLYESYTFTDEELLAYVEENPSSFHLFDYQYYLFNAECDADATEEEIKAAHAAAKEEANSFMTDAETLGEQAFIVALRTDKDCDEEQAKKYLDEQYTMTDSVLFADNEFTLWALNEEREIGDVNVYWDETNERAIVYRLLSEGEFEDTCYRDVRHILFNFDQYETKEAAKAEAERVLALYQAGDKTAEAFGALAKEYTNDGNGDVGGLYEDVTPGQMVEPFENWLFDDSRVIGDVDIVETTFGYHIMYFAGEGDEIWKATAEETLRDEAMLEGYKALLEEYPVTYDADVIDKIDA